MTSCKYDKHKKRTEKIKDKKTKNPKLIFKKEENKKEKKKKKLETKETVSKLIAFLRSGLGFGWSFFLTVIGSPDLVT